MSETDWTDAEWGALANFLGSTGALKSALEKYTAMVANEHRRQCANYMASVPRNHEQAADHAAKAQALDEFWAVLADLIAQEQRELPLTESL